MGTARRRRGGRQATANRPRWRLLWLQQMVQLMLVSIINWAIQTTNNALPQQAKLFTNAACCDGGATPPARCSKPQSTQTHTPQGIRAAQTPKLIMLTAGVADAVQRDDAVAGAAQAHVLGRLERGLRQGDTNGGHVKALLKGTEASSVRRLLMACSACDPTVPPSG